MDPSGEKLKYGFLNNYATLVHRLSASSILDDLYGEGVINVAEKETIKGQYGEDSKASHLLDIIFRQGNGDPEIFTKLFYLLSEKTEGQKLDGVLEKIREDSQAEEVQQKFQYIKKELTKGDRLALEKNKKLIVETLAVNNVLPALVTCGAISSANKGKILAEKSQDDQARCLFHIIGENGSPTVDLFVVVLEESDQYQSLGSLLRKDRAALAEESSKRSRIKKSVIDHDILMEDLKDISAKYESFGINLGVPPSEIRKFKEAVTGRDGLVDYCVNMVIEAWLAGDGADVSRECLAEAVEAVGGFPKVVTEIRQQDFPIKMKNMAKILKAIKPLRHKYSLLGIQLGLSFDKIKEFEKQQGDSERCLSEVLRYWLRMDGEDTADKETLWEALEEIGNKRLQQKLKEDYQGIDFPSR